MRIDGLSNGNVTCQNVCQLLDPSISAASYGSSGIACNPASSTRNTNGVHCQTSTAITESIASFGDAVHVKLSVLIPIQRSVPLIAPKSGLSISRQTTPTTTLGSIIGTSKLARNSPRPRIREFNNSANPSPSRNSQLNAATA